MSRAGAIIVTHNSEDVVGACVESCLRHDLDVIVVDNCSQDRTLDVVRSFLGVPIIANRTNHGFAAAANQGFQDLTADCLLLLNPDAEILTPVTGLVEALRQGAGAAAGKLVDKLGRPQKGFAIRRFPTAATLCLEAAGINRLWPGNPVNVRYRYFDRDMDVPGEVEQPAGAFLMVSRKVWQSVGGFDESFHPVWFEDVDFCLRLRKSGHRIAYVPRVVARHVGGHSVKSTAEGRRAIFWYGNLLRYAAKHFRPAGRRAVAAAVMASAVPRMVWVTCRERSLRSLPGYGKVWTLALRALLSASSERADSPQAAL